MHWSILVLLLLLLFGVTFFMCHLRSQISVHLRMIGLVYICKFQLRCAKCKHNWSRTNLTQSFRTRNETKETLLWKKKWTLWPTLMSTFTIINWEHHTPMAILYVFFLYKKFLGWPGIEPVDMVSLNTRSLIASAI